MRRLVCTDDVCARAAKWATRAESLLRLPLPAHFLCFLSQVDLLAVHALDPVGGDVVMLPTCLRIVLRELDALAFYVVHGADGLAIRADDLHVLADIRVHHGVSFRGVDAVAPMAELSNCRARAPALPSRVLPAQQPVCAAGHVKGLG